jgi:hypothetical protein
MPRYYFHVRERGEIVVHDSVGVEIMGDNLEVAELRRILRSFLQEEARKEDLPEFLDVQVVDQSGRTIAVLPLRSAFSDPDI